MKNNKNFFSLKSLKKALSIFFVGMAGSGKTTLLHRISLELSFKKEIHYLINIDPASLAIPYSPNIDIRDTINYKKIMKDYGLGPNGAILASLNLFSTRFDQIQKLIEHKKSEIKYILIDTPGQIEIFTWSASGSIISEAFSKNFSVILFYIVDIARTIHPLTFVSNILYSCSILYKTRLPIIMILNKIDITSIDFLREWLIDYEAFDSALENENFFANTFSRSLALTLENFHQKIPFLGISALFGIGSFKVLKFLKRINVEFSISFQFELENNIFKYIILLNSKNFKKDKIVLGKKKGKTKDLNFKKNQKNYLNKNEVPEFLNALEYFALLQIEDDKIYSLHLK